MKVRIRYQVYTAAGELMRGNLTVETVREAVTQLHNQGLFIVNIEKVPAWAEFGPAIWRPLRRRVPLKGLAIFLRQFSSLFSAGLPLLSCLTVLEEESTYPALRDACRSLRQEIARGRSFSQALRSQGRLFPALLIYMTEAAEATGNLDKVFSRLAANYEREVRLRERLWSAAAYPLFVLCLAAVVSMVMVRLVLPQFLGLLGDIEVVLPAPTRLLLALGQPSKQRWLVLVIGSLSVSTYIFLRTRRGVHFRDRQVLKLPLIGPLVARAHLARFCHSLSLCLRSGIPLISALGLVKETALNRVFVEELERVRTGIQRGAGLAELLGNSRTFPKLLVQMVRVGEEAGNLEEMLEQAAEFYERELDYSLTLLSAVAEPVLVLLVGGIVGFVVLSVMLPLLSVLGTVV